MITIIMIVMTTQMIIIAMITTRKIITAMITTRVTSTWTRCSLLGADGARWPWKRIGESHWRYKQCYDGDDVKYIMILVVMMMMMINSCELINLRWPMLSTCVMVWSGIITLWCWTVVMVVVLCTHDVHKVFSFSFQNIPFTPPSTLGMAIVRHEKRLVLQIAWSMPHPRCPQ